MIAPTRTCRGIPIHPAPRNSAGIRWYAVVNGRNLRADTLRGIRQLILDALNDTTREKTA